MKLHQKFTKSALGVAISLAVTGAIAQEKDGSKSFYEEEVVVTGTPSGGELRKVDASFAITNLTTDDVAKFAPKSTADLLKLVPGVWSESSGGVAGANIFVRGFPGAGDAPFVTIQLDGAPVFAAPTVSFLENSTLFRVDETIERVEALRGGPQVVQDNGQPGLTTNFLLKEGGEETEGLIKYTTSDYDLQRFDAVLSGKLDEDLYYMIGGYTKSTPGMRDTGFNSEEGQQFTINLTKKFDKGSLNAYTRVTDDHGVWFLPSPLNVPGVDTSFTQVGTLNRQQTIQFGPDGEEKSVDLGEGRGWDGSISGINVDLEINDHWSLSNNLNFTKGDADTLGLVPFGAAVNVGEFIANPSDNANLAVTGPLVGAVTGRAIDDSEYIQQLGVWEVRKQIQSATNNLALTGSYDAFDLTVGYYTATLSVDEQWALGNQKFYVVEQGGEALSGDSIACNSDAIDSCTWNYDIDATGDTRSDALYFSATFRVSEVLDLDVGVRNETHDVEYTVDEGRDGVITKFVEYSESETSYTVGANYSFSDEQGVFARYSLGYKFPYFDDFRDNYDAYTFGDRLLNEVEQLEFGYKASFDNFSAYATVFAAEVLGNSITPQPGDVGDRFGNESYGIELDGKWFHDSGFSLALNATFQETEITNTADPLLEGNQAPRQPNDQIRLTPSYDFDLSGDVSATVYGTASLIGERYSDLTNQVPLDSYEKLDLGAIINVGDNLSFQIAGDNITDEQGITEGDPRDITAPSGRFIMPRNIRFSISYQL